MGLPARNPELLVIQFGGRVGGRTHPTPRLGRCGAFYGWPSFRRSVSGSLAKFAAMQRASSLVSPVGRRAVLRFVVEIEATERLPGRVTDNEALGVLIDGPRRREAARAGHGTNDSTARRLCFNERGIYALGQHH